MSGCGAAARGMGFEAVMVTGGTKSVRDAGGGAGGGGGEALGGLGGRGVGGRGGDVKLRLKGYCNV